MRTLGSGNTPDKTLQILELRNKAVEWTAEEWELHLKGLETSLSETLISYPAYNRRQELQTETIFKKVADRASEKTQKKTHALLMHLTVHQKKIIELLFWENKSERDVAKHLGISRSTVRILQKRSIQRLKKVTNFLEIK